MQMQLGIDHLLSNPVLLNRLAGRRCALVGHPASVTSTLTHSLDALANIKSVKLSAAFGPQHGMRGDKQDNMVESATFNDPQFGFPVYSLYGEVRRPTAEMMESFDHLLFDVQDLGCRIYTYITTLLYLLEECAKFKKSIWVLDRPNPAGRPIEGTILEPGWESFVGASHVIMRHGLTIGEIAQWYKQHHQVDVDLEVIKMRKYSPSDGPGYGWPINELAWVNPSPNAANLNMARCFPGTVMLEGTTLSEGRGTTRALEVMGAPDIDAVAILKKMQIIAPDYLLGAQIRPCWFEPTFHKHQGKMCQGLQIHTDYARYQHLEFKPYRVVCLFLKCLRLLYPEYPIWRYHAYEYEHDRTPIDLINGGSFIRLWIDDNNAIPSDLEARLAPDEEKWRESIQPVLLY